jgi:hypothetical protein
MAPPVKDVEDDVEHDADDWPGNAAGSWQNSVIYCFFFPDP